jgi:hypothetical protein
MRYFYYRIYKALTKVKTNNTPALNAIILITILQGFNVFTIYIILDHFLKPEFEKQQVIIGGGLLYFILFAVNYTYLFRKRSEIARRYENETKEDKTWGIIGLLLYIVVSIAIFFILGETIIQKHY